MFPITTATLVAVTAVAFQTPTLSPEAATQEATYRSIQNTNWQLRTILWRLGAENQPNSDIVQELQKAIQRNERFLRDRGCHLKDS